MKTFGCIQSGESSKDIIYNGTLSMPSYIREPITSITDQGALGSCVSQSLYELYAFYRQFKHEKLDISPTYSFDLRKDKSINGMQPREALSILKKNNKIESYARINNSLALKDSIIVNGGALIALPARSDKPNFWDGPSNLGYHAVCAYGFDSDYIYFKNSWGLDWAQAGCWKFPWIDFTQILEIWTILT